MQELFAQVLIQARNSWRFRWHAITCAWVLAIIGCTYVLVQPDVYEARARVFVDTDSVIKPLLSGLTVDTNVQSRVAMMSQVLMSRPNLEKVARHTDLYLRAPTQEAFARMVDLLPSQIALEAGGHDNTYTLRYSDTDPAMAQRIVQTLLDAFVEDTLGVKRADTNTAQEFLEQQIREYEARLREAEDRLAKFKKDNVGLLPGETGDYYTRLQAAEAKLLELRSQYRLVEERRIELTKQLDGEVPTFGLFEESSAAGSTDGRVAEYRRQLDQLLLQYTDKHPKVIALKETIANLEAQSAADSGKKRTGGAPLPKNPQEAMARALDINPVYQNLRVGLSKTQVELAELREQIAEYQGKVGSLRAKVDTIPQIEAELTRLNRDYEVNRAQHQQLLQRLESARLSEEAEASTENVKFRIIEPAALPLIPIAPNRGLLMTAALLIALGAGVALAVALGQLKPVFLSRAMLKDITGLPVLGTISLLAPKVDRGLLRREPVLVGAAFGGLLVAYLVSIVLAERTVRLLQTLLS
jgi:polysaccharide chain length determinant protein (PEP-CTERM system associated)